MLRAINILEQVPESSTLLSSGPSTARTPNVSGIQFPLLGEPVDLCKGSWVLPISDGFQLRDDLQVFWAAGGPLQADESLQVDATAGHTEELNFDGMWKERLVAPSSGDLAQSVESTQRCREGEVESALNRRRVKAKG